MEPTRSTTQAATTTATAKNKPTATQGFIKKALSRYLGFDAQQGMPAPNTHNHNALGIDNSWDYDAPALQVLLGNGSEPAPSRNTIYAKYQQMMCDPITSAALKLHVTAALGGHESKGEIVFIEASPHAQKDATKAAMVEEIKRDLSPLFNRVAATVAFNCVGYGDAYARIYAKEGVGVVDLYCDEMVLPPLIQPYERGNATIGFRVASGKTQNEELHIGQLARFKMPRMLYQPQQRVQEKAYRLIMREDDLDKLPALPALIGGSILDGAEVSYDRMSTALASMVGSRLLDSIDETLIGVSLTAASVDQRREYLAGLRRMFEASRDYAAELIKSGKPSFGKITHLLPMSGDKQLIEIKGGMSGNGSKQSYTIDDVMMHARLHAGALGIDLSMLGFADQLSGGFGEGGFFRVSAQAASCSANVRGALTAGFNHIANIHCLHRYGVAFDAADLPWQLTYYSGISALENERAATVLSKINSAGLLLQSMAAMRELGMDEAAMLFMLKEQFGLQEAEAKLYAQQLAKQPPAEFESETEV